MVIRLGTALDQQPFYVTDEDGGEAGEEVVLHNTWNYAEQVQRAFEKLPQKTMLVFEL